MRSRIPWLVLCTLLGAAFPSFAAGTVAASFTNTLRLSTEDGETFQARLGERLRDRNREKIGLDDAELGRVAALCRDRRLAPAAAADLLSDADAYHGLLRDAGCERKTLRRELAFFRELAGARGADYGATRARIHAWVRERAHAIIAGGRATGEAEQLLYRHRFYGERGYPGAFGKKGSGAGGPH